MGNRNVEDYLKEGIHGPRRPLEAERRKFLGTLRERIVIALTIGQVMTDAGIKQLEEEMKKHPNTKLIINGQISYRFLSTEKSLARKYNIPYTVVSNEEYKTDIGAVLTYDHAINKEDIFLKEEKDEKEESKDHSSSPLLSRIRSWFS